VAKVDRLIHFTVSVVGDRADDSHTPKMSGGATTSHRPRFTFNPDKVFSSKPGSSSLRPVAEPRGIRPAKFSFASSSFS